MIDHALILTGLSERLRERMVAGYTDISTRPSMYPAVLSCNVAPYRTSPEIDTKETPVSRSYDDSYMCLTCKGIESCMQENIKK